MTYQKHQAIYIPSPSFLNDKLQNEQIFGIYCSYLLEDSTHNSIKRKLKSMCCLLLRCPLHDNKIAKQSNNLTNCHLYIKPNI